MAVAFDTLAYARRLRQAGFSEAQAEAQAEALAAVVDDTLASKQDLRDLATKDDIRELRKELSEAKQDIRDLAVATKQDLQELEHRLTVRVGTMMSVAVGLLAALVKLL